MGAFTINMYHLMDTWKTDRWYDWIETVIHEMMHAIGFSPNLWVNFKNKIVE